MTVLNSRVRPSPDAAPSPSAEGALVLLGFGLAEAPPAGLPPLRAVAQRLAGLLSLPIDRLSPLADPDAALTALAGPAGAGGAAPAAGQPHPGEPGPGALAVLELDAGLALPAGGSWVEALGAWRQPCLLVIGADQMACGWPAAGTALLQRWGVPLLGLLQWGGDWDTAARRRDGLPWLGMASEGEPGPSVGADGGEDSGEDTASRQAALAVVLKRRWQHLDLS